MSYLFYVIAIVLFILAALGVTIHGHSDTETIALGLSAFALAHVLP